MAISEASPQGSIEPPKCIAIVTCNEIIEDKRTNNKTLVSLFNSIVTGALPMEHPRLCLMVSQINGIGKWPLKIRITDPSGQQTAELSGEVKFDDPLSVHDLILDIRRLQLHAEGTYTIDILAGTSPIAERRFNVQVLQKDNEDAQ